MLWVDIRCNTPTMAGMHQAPINRPKPMIDILAGYMALAIITTNKQQRQQVKAAEIVCATLKRKIDAIILREDSK